MCVVLTEHELLLVTMISLIIDYYTVDICTTWYVLLLGLVECINKVESRFD